MADFYRTLGLSRDACESDVKKAFRRIALECHPDRHTGSPPEVKAQAGARFKAASEAYDTLVDAKKRATYNTRSSSPSSSSPYSRQYNPHSYTQHAYYHSARPRGSMFNFFSVLARNMTRTDALFHAGIAALLVMGVTVGSNSGEWLWSSWNRGRLFEDIKAGENRVSRKPSSSSATAARAAAEFAASGGRPKADTTVPSFAAQGTLSRDHAAPAAREEDTGASMSPRPQPLAEQKVSGAEGRASSEAKGVTSPTSEVMGPSVAEGRASPELAAPNGAVHVEGGQASKPPDPDSEDAVSSCLRVLENQKPLWSGCRLCRDFGVKDCLEAQQTRHIQG